MNRPIHMLAGSITASSVYTVIKKSLGEEPTLGELLILVSCGAFVGILPDKLEPAESPFHRGFFHSVLLLVGGGYLIYRYYYKRDVSKDGIWIAINALCAAYGSHLVLDSLSPMGLPLIHRGC